MEKLTFKVNEYEGPLDLILALLSKHQIGIYDINISDLLEQYMAYIRTLRQQKHLTQRQLADTIGVSDKAVSKWERGVSHS